MPNAPSTPNSPLATAQMPEAIHIVPENVQTIKRFAGVLTPGSEYRAVVTLEKGGEFEILFYPTVAPNSVANFIGLARADFYDGVTFHRVIDNFMAQGGDPEGTGGGGPGYTIPDEFSGLPHERGTVSMARPPMPNSAGSQFFITFQRTAYLDGQYTIFGQVVRGMEHVDGLRRRDPNRNPDYEGDRIADVKIVENPSAAS